MDEGSGAEAPDRGLDANASRQPNLRAAYALTVLVAVAMAVVSAVGTFASQWLYRDNPLVLATFRGQDVLTLFVAVPLLVLGLVLELRGSMRGRVLWIAMLFYGFYAYLFYAVGAAFNAMFLLYLAVFGMSLYALVFSVPRMDVTAIDAAITGKAARGVTVAYLLLVVAGLSMLWVGMSLGYVFTGVVPGPIVASGHPTAIVFAIDLVFLVPPMLLAAVWLIRRRPWGGFLGSVLAVAGSMYTLTLTAASIETARVGVATGGELPIWVGLTVLGAVAAGLMLAQMDSARSVGRR